MNRRRVTVIGLLTLLAALLSSLYAGAQTDPLPSWNDGPAKPLIVKFVHAVTDPASPTTSRPSSASRRSTTTEPSGSSSRCTSSSPLPWTA